MDFNLKNNYRWRALYILFILLLFNIVSAEIKVPNGEIWLLVRGDDIGLCHGVNTGMEESYRNGILKSTEIMVPPAWFSEGVEICKRNPGLDVGIHLTLTSEWTNYKYKPVALFDRKPNFINEDGYFFPRTRNHPLFDNIFKEPYSLIASQPKLENIEKELRAQIEMAMQKIDNITHLSNHMLSMRATPELERLYKKLANEYNLVTDIEFRKESNTLQLFSVPAQEKVDSLASMLTNIKPGFWYLVVHPGIDSPEMRAINAPTSDADMNMAQHRSAVTDALTSEKIKKIIKERNIKLVNHRDIIEAGLLERK